jgi:hypothetical protein
MSFKQSSSDSKNDYKGSSSSSATASKGGSSKDHPVDDLDEEILYSDEGKDYSGENENTEDKLNYPQVNIIEIEISPNKPVEITSSLSLKMKFELDRDVIAAYWIVKLLVDSAHSRIIQILGQTDVEDYPDGESDMSFSVDSISVDNIPPSTLANSGLLMAVFMVDGEEVATVNMVVQVYKKDGMIIREILSPLE